MVLEDDLELADDAVAFFNGMTWPMSRDPTIFCACAHQDNAYYATRRENGTKREGPQVSSGMKMCCPELFTFVGANILWRLGL